MALDLGHRLAIARHARRLSQQAVAKAVGITQKHLSQAEHGHVPFLSLASGTVLRLAEVLGVSTDYLLGRTGTEEETGTPRSSAPRATPLAPRPRARKAASVG